MRQRELAATAKAFMLDEPEVSLQALTAHLRVMAEQFLTDASDDYWNGVDVATLVDEKSNLRELEGHKVSAGSPDRSAAARRHWRYLRSD